MSVVLVTGSHGLIGSEAVRRFARAGRLVVGIDNDMRASFFGSDASTSLRGHELIEELGDCYRHVDLDVRDERGVRALFATYSTDIVTVIHTAGQPSHDWAARSPRTDFDINASATLTLLEACRQFSPAATFLFTSTNKVYGDTPNTLPLIELETRLDLPATHPAHGGIDETMTIDASTHSLFGVSKVAADLLVQEYGRYFGMRTAVFRCGCVTGRAHSGASLHGFLAYLVRCFKERRAYDVIGYGGKQVRDNIDGEDVAALFAAYAASPPRGSHVYNLGGGRANSCSVLEAIDLCTRLSGRSIPLRFEPTARIGDHRWYITNLERVQHDFPGWRITRSLEDSVTAMFESDGVLANRPRVSSRRSA